ncbi:putative PEPTIDE SYNTHETASE NRP domain protein [Mycobacterium xenopi 4042]|uniref:Putative PEPTIDE SYNTHETASE NRP domain protein n=1 Tax=Mycobacterium xenopi 4042 TaxID=1299334 RepID=X7YLU2_MYCXE|nr:putative PEPTIDE SYNTHETASE NRP domain protein [Mycobacterium xenopi 4042]
MMINVYGPTETTMWASKSVPLKAGGGPADRFASVRCGCFRPGWLVAAGAGGVVGELYVAVVGSGVGIGVGRG